MSRYASTDITRFSICGIKFNDLTTQESVDSLMCRKQADKTRIGYVVDATALNKAFHDDTLRATINAADYVLPDRGGVTMAARSKGLQVKDGVDRASMLELLVTAAVREKKSIYFLSDTPGVAWKAVKRLKQRHPRLIVAGCSHGPLDQSPTEELIGDINDSGADILLVGMATPTQENWIHQNKGQLQPEAVLGVGWLLDFYAGLTPQAPALMRHMGIEWLWLLAQALRLRIKRNILDNSLLVLRATLDPEQ